MTLAKTADIMQARWGSHQASVFRGYANHKSEPNGPRLRLTTCTVGRAVMGPDPSARTAAVVRGG